MKWRKDASVKRMVFHKNQQNSRVMRSVDYLFCVPRC